MATVNRQSLREEYGRLKSEFERLLAEGRITPESRALFRAMMTLFDLLVAIFMEKTTTKSNRNSSKPSSQTSKDETATGHPGSKGKGKAENDASSSNTRTVEKVQVATVTLCENCGEDLADTRCLGHERRTMIDIVFEKVTTHVDAEIKTCPVCKTQTKGVFPAAMPGPLQYGSGIKAYALNLLVAQMVSLNRIQKLMKTLLGRVISEATMLNWVLRLHYALEDWEACAIEKILTRPVIHVDETSLRVDKKNHWIHVSSSGDITLKFLHRKRGGEAIEEIGVIPRYDGVVIHDCWASYLSYNHCGHGLCGSHLLRELVFIKDANGYRWAANMKRLLQTTCVRVSTRKRKKLTEAEYAKLQKGYRNILTRGEKELPAIPPKPKGKRGRIAKSDAHNLLDRLKQHETAVLLFAKESHVPFTNNRAERDLRMAKVKQKVSGCFRTQEHAKAYCRISSYLQTMANRGYNPLVALQMALLGHLGAKTGE
jgi:transposase